MTRAQLLRLIWIDAFVSAGHRPLLRRAHLELAFEISTPQASLDLRMFMARFPGRLAYDKSARGYQTDRSVSQPFTTAEHNAVLLTVAYLAEAQARIDAALEE